MGSEIMAVVPKLLNDWQSQVDGRMAPPNWASSQKEKSSTMTQFNNQELTSKRLAREIQVLCGPVCCCDNNNNIG